MTEEIAREQSENDDLDILLKWLNNKDLPSEKELFLASPATEAYWLNKEMFKLIGGVFVQDQRSTGQHCVSYA